MTERRIAVLLVISTVAALGLAGVYVSGGQPQLEGALLATSLGTLGAAVILWSKHFFPQEEVTAERPSLQSRPEDREAFARSFEQGEEHFTRRSLLTKLLGASLGALGLAALFPIRSLGPSVGSALRQTAWRRGIRLVAENGRPIRLGDLEQGGVLTVFPEGHTHDEDAATLLIRVDVHDLRLPKERVEWAPNGHVAYSKICPHVGCPVGLYQESDHVVLCPCHQSTFNVLDGAEPVFGPATRRLPQLPLGVDEEGYLIARSDYPDPVGPVFWDRDRS